MNRQVARRISTCALVPLMAAGGLIASHAAQPDAMNKQAPAAAASASNANASSSPQAQPTAIRQQRASRIIGMNVRGPKGENLGEIEDLAIDMKTGQVHFAVLEFDPGFLSGERLIPIPVKELKMAQNNSALVYQKADKAQLEKRSMNKSDWNDGFVRSEDRMGKLAEAWGLPRPSGGTLVRADFLMDKEVRNRAGEDIGEIEDLVINMDHQKVHYAMLEFERSWLKPEKTVAVPLTAFSMPANNMNELVMDVNRDRVKDMQGLTREQIRDPDDPRVVAVIERHIVFLDPASNQAAGSKSDTRASGAGASGASGTGAADSKK